MPPRGAGPSDFNPRTPVGCDFYRGAVNDLHGISIHAPQWGATHPAAVVPRGRHISIHAPQWGATLARVSVKPFKPPFQSTHPSGVRRQGSLKIVLLESKFQSTHPSGVRPALPRQSLGHLVISIHAPQWGATTPGGSRRHQPIISIHAPQWGATTHDHGPQTNIPQFQSTHPSGVRHRQWLHDNVTV